MILAAVAGTWGPGLKNGMWRLCVDAPVPDGFPPEARVDTETTLWPLGHNCIFEADTAASVTIYETDWIPTIFASVGAAIVMASIIATIGAYTRWRHR